MTSAKMTVRAALTAAALTLVACGGGDEAATDRIADSTTTSVTTAATTTPTTEAESTTTSSSSTTTTPPTAAPTTATTAPPVVPPPTQPPPPPPPPTVAARSIVPNLVGLRLPQATAATAAARLRIAWSSHCDNRVTSQNPAPGTAVTPGSTVRVELVPCIVPNVVGLGLEQARTRVINAGLRVSWGDYCDDEVTAQNPPAGRRVEPQTTVRLTLVAC